MRTRNAVVIAAVVLLAAGGTTAAVAYLGNPPELKHSERQPFVEDDEDLGSVEVYAVLADGSLEPSAGEAAARVWSTFLRVATTDFAAEVMTEYRAGNAPDSDTLAYVYPSDDREFWVLAANLATSQDTEQLIATLIHEYAHILTLDSTQVAEHSTECETMPMDEGCPHPDSLIAEFHERFWAPYGAAAPGPDNSDADLAWEFYLDHEDDFVSDYAATNVVEDIAESFMTFVLEEQPNPDAGPLAQKLVFFWDEPDLVAIRERIRAEFAVDLGLHE